MSGGKDFLIIFGIIIGLGLLAIFAGNVDTQNPFDRQFTSFGDRGSSIRTSGGNVNSQQQNSATSIEKEIEKIQVELEEVEKELEKLQRFGEESSYKGMVTIKKSSSGPKATDVNKEYITLTSPKSSSGVIISEWKLESEITGKSISIGKASKLIYSGRVNTEENIVLSPGDTIYITTGRSPVGRSFKVNKCSGYTTQFQKFTPTLRKSCPLPEDEILFYKDKTIFSENACIDFVERIPRCEIHIGQLPLNLSNSCQNAIAQEINYNSCIDKHKNDDDFKKPQWRIFLRRENELWREKREIIKLLDENGKIVDIFSY